VQLFSVIKEFHSYTYACRSRPFFFPDSTYPYLDRNPPFNNYTLFLKAEDSVLDYPSIFFVRKDRG
jgi:hypothetical protein